MNMPTQPVLDVMRRTMANLEFIEANRSRKGPYEVTQLINSFLGALVHPLEEFPEDLARVPLGEAEVRGWPRIAKERPADRDPGSIAELIRFMRNAMAHGNIEFLPDALGEIAALRLWNVNRGRRTWGTIVTVRDARKLLTCFADLIEQRHRSYGWYMPRSA